MKTRIIAAMIITMAALVPATPAMALNDGNGIHVVSSAAVNNRILDVNVTSGALTVPATLRVMLPDGYAANPNRRYPVLYLLHGGGGTHTDWTNLGAEQTTAGLPVIIVQPDGGKGSWFADAVVPGLEPAPIKLTP